MDTVNVGNGGSPWLPTPINNYSGPFRVNIRHFLRIHATKAALQVKSIHSYFVPLTQKGGPTINLHIYEEKLDPDSSCICDACRNMGWQFHPVCNRRYHFIIPSDRTLSDLSHLPSIVEAMARGESHHKNTVRMLSVEVDNHQEEFVAEASVLDSASHHLHGVLHANGYGHLLRMNAGGQHNLTGKQLLAIWDSLCTLLRAREVSVEDVSNKSGMLLRLLHTAAYGHSWYGKWGYIFGRGTYNISAAEYKQAVETVQHTRLEGLVRDLQNVDPTASKVLTLYSKVYPGVTELGPLLQRMLHALSHVEELRQAIRAYRDAARAAHQSGMYHAATSTRPTPRSPTQLHTASLASPSCAPAGTNARTSRHQSPLNPVASPPCQKPGPRTSDQSLADLLASPSQQTSSRHTSQHQQPAPNQLAPPSLRTSRHHQPSSQHASQHHQPSAHQLTSPSCQHAGLHTSDQLSPNLMASLPEQSAIPGASLRHTRSSTQSAQAAQAQQSEPHSSRQADQRGNTQTTAEQSAEHDQVRTYARTRSTGLACDMNAADDRKHTSKRKVAPQPVDDAHVGQMEQQATKRSRVMFELSEPASEGQVPNPDVIEHASLPAPEPAQPPSANKVFLRLRPGRQAHGASPHLSTKAAGVQTADADADAGGAAAAADAATAVGVKAAGSDAAADKAATATIGAAAGAKAVAGATAVPAVAGATISHHVTMHNAAAVGNGMCEEGPIIVAPATQPASKGKSLKISLKKRPSVSPAPTTCVPHAASDAKTLPLSDVSPQAGTGTNGCSSTLLPEVHTTMHDGGAQIEPPSIPSANPASGPSTVRMSTSIPPSVPQPDNSSAPDSASHEQTQPVQSAQRPRNGSNTMSFFASFVPNAIKTFMRPSKRASAAGAGALNEDMQAAGMVDTQTTAAAAAVAAVGAQLETAGLVDGMQPTATTAAGLTGSNQPTRTPLATTAAVPSQDTLPSTAAAEATNDTLKAAGLSAQPQSHPPAAQHAPTPTGLKIASSVDTPVSASHQRPPSPNGSLKIKLKLPASMTKNGQRGPLQSPQTGHALDGASPILDNPNMPSTRDMQHLGLGLNAHRQLSHTQQATTCGTAIQLEGSYMLNSQQQAVGPDALNYPLPAQLPNNLHHATRTVAHDGHDQVFQPQVNPDISKPAAPKKMSRELRMLLQSSSSPLGKPPVADNVVASQQIGTHIPSQQFADNTAAHILHQQSDAPQPQDTQTEAQHASSSDAQLQSRRVGDTHFAPKKMSRELRMLLQATSSTPVTSVTHMPITSAGHMNAASVSHMQEATVAADQQNLRHEHKELHSSRSARMPHAAAENDVKPQDDVQHDAGQQPRSRSAPMRHDAAHTAAQPTRSAQLSSLDSFRRQSRELYTLTKTSLPTHGNGATHVPHSIKQESEQADQPPPRSVPSCATCAPHHLSSAAHVKHDPSFGTCVKQDPSSTPLVKPERQHQDIGTHAAQGHMHPALSKPMPRELRNLLQDAARHRLSVSKPEAILQDPQGHAAHVTRHAAMKQDSSSAHPHSAPTASSHGKLPDGGGIVSAKLSPELISDVSCPPAKSVQAETKQAYDSQPPQQPAPAVPAGKMTRELRSLLASASRAAFSAPSKSVLSGAPCKAQPGDVPLSTVTAAPMVLPSTNTGLQGAATTAGTAAGTDAVQLPIATAATATTAPAAHTNPSSPTRLRIKLKQLSGKSPSIAHISHAQNVHDHSMPLAQPSSRDGPTAAGTQVVSSIHMQGAPEAQGCATVGHDPHAGDTARRSKRLKGTASKPWAVQSAQPQPQLCQGTGDTLGLAQGAGAVLGQAQGAGSIPGPGQDAEPALGPAQSVRNHSGRVRAGMIAAQPVHDGATNVLEPAQGTKGASEPTQVIGDACDLPHGAERGLRSTATERASHARQHISGTGAPHSALTRKLLKVPSGASLMGTGRNSNIQSPSSHRQLRAAAGKSPPGTLKGAAAGGLVQRKRLLSPRSDALRPSGHVLHPKADLSPPSKHVVGSKADVSSPNKRTAFSRNQPMQSPQKRLVSPGKPVHNPQKRIASPSQPMQSSQKRLASPNQQMLSPQKRVASPDKQLHSPQKRLRPTDQTAAGSPPAVSPGSRSNPGKIATVTRAPTHAPNASKLARLPPTIPVTYLQPLRNSAPGQLTRSKQQPPGRLSHDATAASSFDPQPTYSDNPRIKPGVSHNLASPTWVLEQTLTDLQYLYSNILRLYRPAQALALALVAGDRPRKPLQLEGFAVAVQMLKDCRFFVKDYQGHKHPNVAGEASLPSGVGDQMMRVLVQVQLTDVTSRRAPRSSLRQMHQKPAVLHAHRSTTPPELIVLPDRATVGDLKRAISEAFSDLYRMFKHFEVDSIKGLKAEVLAGGDRARLGTLPEGRLLTVTGHGIDRDPRWRHAGGPEDWQVLCTCGTDDDDGERMIACDQCGIWMHTRCHAILDQDEVPASFVCPGCLQTAR